MIFLEHNGSSSPSFLRRRLATPAGSQSSLSLTDMDHTFLKNFISLQWPTTSIYFAFHPIPPIAYNLSTLESSDHWEMLSLNAVMRFSRRLEKRFRFRTLSRSTCTHVLMHSNPRPSKKLSRIAESLLLTLTSLQMWTMLQAYHPRYMLMPHLLTQQCQLCLHNEITPPMTIQITTQTLMNQTATNQTMTKLTMNNLMHQIWQNNIWIPPRQHAQLKDPHPCRNASLSITHLPLQGLLRSHWILHQQSLSAMPINDPSKQFTSTRTGQRKGNLRL